MGGLPSLVIQTSPTSSTIILSSPWGPSEDLTMWATDMAARTKIIIELPFSDLTSLPVYLYPSMLTAEVI